MREQKSRPNSSILLKLFDKKIDATKTKWALTALTGIFVLIFEFIRHEFMHDINMDWGNLLVALFSSILFLLYFTFIFRLMQNLYISLNEKKSHLAILSERDRIARGLHDNIAQSLFFMNIKIQEAEKFLKERDITLSSIDELKEAVQHIDRDIRSNIFLLKGLNTFDMQSLRHTIENTARLIYLEDKMQVEASVDERLNQVLPAAAKQKIISILRELFLNIKKHAQAENVWVNLAHNRGRVVLRIEDNGRGFAPGSFNKRGSFGLQNIAHDVEALGGSLVLAGGHGSIITIELPEDF
ncbi:MAG: histidine kinase [Candidatus Adiutrix sp.]|jgi:signal transduction histidine kinase|nr:histidine kinase [Candidatus Adiutrix sp.]